MAKRSITQAQVEAAKKTRELLDLVTDTHAKARSAVATADRVFNQYQSGMRDRASAMSRIHDLLFDFDICAKGPMEVVQHLERDFDWLPRECHLVLVAANRKETKLTAKSICIAANLALWMAQVETGQQSVGWRGDRYNTAEAVYAAVVEPLEKAKNAKPAAADTKGCAE